MVSSEGWVVLNRLGAYSAPFSGSIYGEIIEIPDYLSSDEWSRIAPFVSSESVSSDIYPNLSLWENHEYNLAFNKTKSIYDAWSLLTDNDAPHGIKEKLQVSPANMREYPMHTDHGSKALTILVPIAPGVSTPTRFHGYRGQHPIKSIPWQINHAYMFVPDSKLTYHSYVGGDSDRYVLNINFLYK